MAKISIRHARQFVTISSKAACLACNGQCFVVIGPEAIDVCRQCATSTEFEYAERTYEPEGQMALVLTFPKSKARNAHATAKKAASLSL